MKQNIRIGTIRAFPNFLLLFSCRAWLLFSIFYLHALQQSKNCLQHFPNDLLMACWFPCFSSTSVFSASDLSNRSICFSNYLICLLDALQEILPSSFMTKVKIVWAIFSLRVSSRHFCTLILYLIAQFSFMIVKCYVIK